MKATKDYKKTEDYKPIEGFFDLRNWKLPKKVFMSLWRTQELLNFTNKRSEYYKKFLPIEWQKAQELSANYQQLLFSYEGAV